MKSDERCSCGPARPQSAEQLLDAYYGKPGSSKVIQKSQEIYRFAVYAASELARLQAEGDSLRDALPQIREALQLASERFEYAPHTITGFGGVTEHYPKNCTRCKVAAALAALPDPPKGEVK